MIDCSIITNFQISIRPCEIEKICAILEINVNKYSKSNDYWTLMNYLKNYNTNIVEIIKSDEESFQNIFNYLFPNKKKYFGKNFLSIQKKVFK